MMKLLTFFADARDRVDKKRGSDSFILITCGGNKTVCKYDSYFAILLFYEFHNGQHKKI